MLKASNKILICLLLLATAAFSQTQLIHFPVNSATEGQPVQLEVKIEGLNAQVIFVRIYYKAPEEDSYRYVDMQPDINKWIGNIPGRDVEGERLEYFLNAFLSNQQIVTFPVSNPYNQPEEIQIFPAKKSAVPSPPVQNLDTFVPAKEAMQSAIDSPLLVLSPEPDEYITEDQVLFAVSLSGGGKETDAKSVQIFMDGKNVTRACEISTFMATFEPKKVSEGQHWFKVVAKDIDGKPLEPIVVNFTVGSEGQKQKIRSDFRGHVFADFRNETVYEQDNSFNMGGGDFSGQYGVLQYSGRFLVSSLEDPNYQPRDSYSFNLKTKVLGISGGDTYPRINDLILWGKRVRGLSGYIHLGFINVDAVMGETYRGIEGVGTGIGPSMVISSYGTFSQKLMAVRPSIGGGKHFQVGISIVKIQDDTSSIKYGILPKDNVIFGPDLKLAFDRGRTTLTAAGAVSLLTSDISGGALTPEDINDITGEEVNLPFNPQDFEEYFIINDSTIPIDPSKLTSMAYNVKLALRYLRNVLQIGYKSVGAQYTSLANPWIRKDIEGFYFNDRLRLLNNKLYLNFGYEDYIDNFSDYSSSPAMDLKTFNYGFSVYPGKSWPNINVSLKNHMRDNGIVNLDLTPISSSAVIDTFDNRERSLHRDLSVQLNYDVDMFDLNHSLFFNYISSDFIDDYDPTRSYSQEFSTDMRMFTLSTRYQLPLKTTISYATNSNISGGGTSAFDYNMFALAGEYRIWRDRITTFAEYRSTTSTSTTTLSTIATEYNRSHIRFGGILHISARHTVTLDGNFLGYSSNSAVPGSNTSYNDRIMRLRWEKFF